MFDFGHSFLSTGCAVPRAIRAPAMMNYYFRIFETTPAPTVRPPSRSQNAGFIHRDGGISSTVLDVVARHHHLRPAVQLPDPSRPSWRSKLRTVPLRTACDGHPPPSSDVPSHSNCVCGRIEPAWPHLPTLHFLALRAARSTPTLSPPDPGRSLRNISTPVHVVSPSAPDHDLHSSLIFTMPRSMRPVTTVPRPEIENTSSTGIKTASPLRASDRD